jgi:hypothetical protein
VFILLCKVVAVLPLLLNVRVPLGGGTLARRAMDDEATRGEIIEASLKLLSDEERARIEGLAQMLMNEIPWRSPARVQFGPRMAYELLWSLGRWMRANED